MQFLRKEFLETLYDFTCFIQDQSSGSEGKRPDIFADLSPASLYSVLFESMSDEESTTEFVPSRFNQHRIFLNTGTTILPNTNDKRKIADEERMLAIIKSCYFEAGAWTEADDFFERLRKSSGDIEKPLKMLSNIVNHNLSNTHILEGILHILSNYDYDEIDPYGITISLACVVNHSPIVQDLLISCFEKWGAPESVDILESLELDECWLIEYRDDVVAQLKNREKTA